MHAQPQPHQGPGTLHTSRRRSLQAQVVTLEQAGTHTAVAPHTFLVSHTVKHQRPRFHESGLLPLDSTRIELEGMRGVLESCWDLSPPTATTPPRLHQQQQQNQQHRHHAQLQRVRRGRGQHVITHAAPPGAGLPAGQDKTPAGQRRSRGRSSAESSLLQAASTVLSDQHTHWLEVVMNLWHVCQVETQRSSIARDGSQLSLPTTPRLLTAAEERVLGSIIQQHRKLQQLWAEHPDIAAAAFSAPTNSSSSLSSSSSSSSSRRDASNPSSSSSSSSSTTGSGSSRQVGPDKRHTWPPALTPEDISEVTQLSQAWRTLLPSLAAQAMELLVTFNSGLVIWSLSRAPNQGVPPVDLLSSALSGLRVGAQRYNPAMGTRFSTVAGMWILQAVQRTSVAESGRVLRRPLHHMAMVSHVLTQHGMDTLATIERRPHVVAEVADKYECSPDSVLEILTSTRDQYNASSLEALAAGSQLKGFGKEDSRSALATLLTTADLDEGEGQLGMPGEDPGISGGVGTLLAAAGQVPLWARAGVHGLQQQEQQGGDDSGSSDGPAAAAAAAAAAVAAAAASPASSVTGTMLDTVDDTEAALQHNLQQMFDLLTPLERNVLVTLYGLQHDAFPGLGVELPPVSVYGSISSSGSSSGADSSSASPSSKQQQQGRKKRQRKAASAGYKAVKGVVTLQEVAAALELPSAYAVSIIRDSALRKLAAGAAAAARAASAGGLAAAGAAAPVAAATAAATAAADGGSSSGSGSSSRSSGYAHAPAAAAATAAAAAEPAALTGGPWYRKGDATLQMVARVQSFVAERGHLPEDMKEQYQGKLIARWVSRIRARYWQDKVPPHLATTIEQLVPGWDWGAPGAVREKYLERKRQREQKERAAAAAAAAGSSGAAADDGDSDSSADAAAAGGGSSTSSTSSSSSSSSRKQVLLNRFARAGAARRTRVTSSTDGQGEQLRQR